MKLHHQPRCSFIRKTFRYHQYRSTMRVIAPGNPNPESRRAFDQKVAEEKDKGIDLGQVCCLCRLTSEGGVRAHPSFICIKKIHPLSGHLGTPVHRLITGIMGNVN